MEFFVPHTDTVADAERIREATKAFARDTLGWEVTERRIFRLEYTHDGSPHSAEVGKVTDANGEEVIAILESVTFLVCTANRGVLRGQPILVGRQEVTWIEDFVG